MLSVAVTEPVVLSAAKSSVGSIFPVTDAPAREGQRGAGDADGAAPQVEPAGHLGRCAGTLDAQLSREFGVQSAPAHEDGARRVDREVEADRAGLRGRSRRLLAGPAHVQHGDGGRQALGDADFGALDPDAPGNLQRSGRLATHREVGVQVHGQPVGGERTRIASRDRKVNRQPRRQHADAAGRRHGARPGPAGEARDSHRVTVRAQARGDVGDAHALGEVLQLAAGELRRPADSGRRRSAGNHRVERHMAPRTSSPGGQHGVEQ